MLRPGAMPAGNLRSLLALAIARRQALVARGQTDAYRVFSGRADGLDGVFIDVYGPGAVLIVYDGRAPKAFDGLREAEIVLDALRPLGVRAVYLKPFARDRSRIGGELPAVVTQPEPAAGETLPESLLIRENGCALEVRLYDGFSTGLFLDQRDNRAFVRELVRVLVAEQPRDAARPSVLNTFAYTSAFSVAAAMGGAVTTSVDVSPRYLEWGKRNFAHNAIELGGVSGGGHRFARMDTFEFFAYARRKQLSYDVIVLDPPSFGSGSKKRGIKPWSAESGYARLVEEAAALLRPRGVIFASTNTQALCRPGRLDREIINAIGRRPQWIDLPSPPKDFADEEDRFAARAFRP